LLFTPVKGSGRNRSFTVVYSTSVIEYDGVYFIYFVSFVKSSLYFSDIPGTTNSGSSGAGGFLRPH